MNAAENAIRVVACIIACAVLAIALGIVSRKKVKAAVAEAETKTAVIVRTSWLLSSALQPLLPLFSP